MCNQVICICRVAPKSHSKSDEQVQETTKAWLIIFQYVIGFSSVLLAGDTLYLKMCNQVLCICRVAPKSHSKSEKQVHGTTKAWLIIFQYVTGCSSVLLPGRAIILASALAKRCRECPESDKEPYRSNAPSLLSKIPVSSGVLLYYYLSLS